MFLTLHCFSGFAVVESETRVCLSSQTYAALQKTAFHMKKILESHMRHMFVTEREDDEKRFVSLEISFQRQRLENHTNACNNHRCSAHDINRVSSRISAQKTVRHQQEREKQSDDAPIVAQDPSP